MDQAKRWKNQIRSWGRTWGMEGLEERVRVSVSPRLRASLGRSLPQRGVVRIARAVADGPRELLDEVLCHEVAHVAVFERHGRVRPHGPEWAALLRQAGFEPRVRLPMPVPARGRTHAHVYEHRCTLCGARRFAKRPVSRWRCAHCAAQGLSGRLEIRSFPAQRGPA